MSRIETVEVGGTEYTLGVDKDSTVTFTEAQTRTNIASGESLATMFGKIKKFFTDLKTVAFTGNISDLTDVTITTPQAEGDVLVSDENGVYQNQPKSLYPSAPKLSWADYKQLVDDEEDDPDAEYYIDDIDVSEAYYVETSGQTAITGATSLTFTNSHIKPTADIRILAEPASCKVSTNPQYKVSAKLSSVGNGTATITFPALAENTEFWLLIECPLAVADGIQLRATVTNTGSQTRAQVFNNLWTYLANALSDDTIDKSRMYLKTNLGGTGNTILKVGRYDTDYAMFYSLSTGTTLSLWSVTVKANASQFFYGVITSNGASQSDVSSSTSITSVELYY